MMINKIKNYEGFTLIELIVVIVIIGILTAISVFSLQGAREASRDTRRKSDLESIRSALELYKSDCNSYPLSLPADLQLIGGDASECGVDYSGNVYMEKVPSDPMALQNYAYSRNVNKKQYILCASLEGGGSSGDTTACASLSCGSTVVCNYRVNNP